jgi:hypothetical protein
MGTKTLTSIGLILDFIGAVVLLIYATKTTGATTIVDQNHLASPWWPRIGWVMVAGGFIFQLFGNIFEH